jgi:hypothetical protein
VLLDRLHPIPDVIEGPAHAPHAGARCRTTQQLKRIAGDAIDWRGIPVCEMRA